MTDNIARVRQFVAAWSRLDVNELVDWFTPDGVYHNMPLAPVVGHEALRPFVAGFLASWESTEWEVLNIVGNGNLVMAERVDRIIINGKSVNLPCCGVFEMRDGKIALWRDYFDLGTYSSALAA